MKIVEVPKNMSSVKRGEEDVSEEIKILRKINDTFKKDGKCFVKVLKGDYKDSIAIFTPEEYEVPEDVVNYRTYSRDTYNVTSYWWGRLSWVGKRNNPKFGLSSSTAVVLDNYQGETLLKRFDLKAKSKELLEGTKPSDIDGVELSEGDEVLYMNLRYGCGGKLCRGVVQGFKAHARDNYLSVIVQQKGTEETSDLSYPHMQILKIGE